MKKFDNLDRKHVDYILLTTICICFIITFFFIVKNFAIVSTAVLSVWEVIYAPLQLIIIGFIMTFFLYQPTDFLHNKLNEIGKFKERTNRVIASITVLVLAILIITLIIYIILPGTIESISSLLVSIQESTPKIEEFFLNLRKNPSIVNILGFFNIDITTTSGIEKTLMTLFTDAQVWIENFATSLVTVTLDIGNAIYNVFMAIFVSLYMLIDKESLTKQVSKVSSAILSERMYGTITYVLGLMDYMFFKFLSGKAFCSLIVGAMAFILAHIFGIKHVSLITFVITITNMVPLFGPIFSVIPCSIFAMISGGPISAIIMILIIIFIQQIDQNVLAPNILGDIVGLNGFWIIVSITFCGKIFGVVGMVIGIPLFAVLKILIEQWLIDREEAGLPPVFEKKK